MFVFLSLFSTFDAAGEASNSCANHQNCCPAVLAILALIAFLSIIRTARVVSTVPGFLSSQSSLVWQVAATV